MIRFKIDKADIKKVQAQLVEKANEIRNDFAVKTYNSIVTGFGTDYPYWSGSYIASWNITVGDKREEPKEPSKIEGKYNPPPMVTNVGFSSFGQPVYISNYAEHAYQVEYKGTYYHPHEGWFTANHALNTVRLSYKYTKA